MSKKNFASIKNTKQVQKQPKRVLIGTPSLDGRVDAWYCFAISEISKLGLLNNIDVQVVLLSYESVLPMARNELLTIAIKNSFDTLVFIDADTCCNPQSFIEIVMDERDVIALPTVNKSDVEGYNIFLNRDSKLEGDWIKVDRSGTGCMKLSKKALEALAKNSELSQFRGKELYNICQYVFEGGHFIGEDIYLCEKLKQLGFDIWVNTNSTCMHIGTKIYKGDFKEALKSMNAAAKGQNSSVS